MAGSNRTGKKLAAQDVAVEIERLQSRIRELEIENDLFKQQT